MNVVAAARERITNTFAESVYDNPVVAKEFRTRMRGWKAFAIMGGYILMLGMVLFITLWSLWRMNSNYSMDLINQNIGQKLFTSLTATQAILLTLMLPSLASSSITHELERKTIEMLVLSRLTAGKIVLGKQLSGFIFAVMLLALSLPLAGLCIMFGGISPMEVAVCYLLLISWSFMFTSIGVFWSSLCKKTATASAASYATCLGYMMISSVSMGMSISYGGSNAFVLGAMNPSAGPYVAMLSAKVCGMTIPIALVAFVLQIAVGALLILTASTHVRYKDVDRALPIKVLYAAIPTVLVWLVVGNMNSIGPATQDSLRECLTFFASLTFAFVSLSTAAFCTGIIRKSEDDTVFTYALSAGKTFANDLAGSISYMLLLTTLIYATLGVTFFWVSKYASVKLLATFWPNYFKLGVSILIMVAGVSAVGILASSLTKLRKNAAALVILFIIVIFAGYGILLINYNSTNQLNFSSPVLHLAAFWPMTPILCTTNEWESMPKLPWQEDAWLVTSIAYFAITSIALALANVAHARGMGVKEEE